MWEIFNCLARGVYVMLHGQEYNGKLPKPFRSGKIVHFDLKMDNGKARSSTTVQAGLAVQALAKLDHSFGHWTGDRLGAPKLSYFQSVTSFFHCSLAFLCSSFVKLIRIRSQTLASHKK